MRSTGLVALALATFAILPSAANADDTYREYPNQCTTGSFQACFSVSVLFVHQPPTQYGPSTTVEIRVANLQGRDSYLPDSGPFSLLPPRIDGLSVSDYPPNFAPYFDYYVWPTLEGGAGPVLPGGGWDYEVISSSLPENSFTSFFIVPNAPPTTLIYGCDLPSGLFTPDQYSGVSPAEYSWQTCQGTLDLNFTLPGTWNFTDATTMSVGISAGPGVSVCGQIGQCTITTTPEPNMIVLLGTGLTGIGGVAFRRRRAYPDA